MSGYSRRDILKSGGVLAVGLMTPPWLASVAKADMLRAAKGSKADPDTVLVVCQWSGGNDGLNTFIPYTDPLYYKNRPTIGIAKEKALDLDGKMGLHPEMVGLHKLFKSGKVAIVQNVGYPNPNRSHFKSMDIWQSASPDDTMKHGWLGRHFDIQADTSKLSAVAGIGLSIEKPLALTAQSASIPCFASLADINNMVGDPEAERMLREIQGSAAAEGSTKRLIQQANNSALDAMSLLQKKLAGFEPKGEYGNDQFGRGFKQIAQLVATSPETRVIYFSRGGFDTHSRQTDAHGGLMKQFSEAVTTFQDEMQRIGKADKVIVMVFSEFGRRVAENGSAGTDHGAAGPMMLIGNRVKGGLYGPQPDLSDLNKGDLRFDVDFRNVYAMALDDWLGGDSKTVLGGSFGSPLGILQ